MNAINVLNIVLWSVQGFLALFFLAAGAPKIFGRGIEKWTGFSDLPRSQVVFIGFVEVLGAVGLVLPMATGVLPWLTPLAAVGLAIIVLMASWVSHASRRTPQRRRDRTLGRHRRRGRDRPLGSLRLWRRRFAVDPGCGPRPAGTCSHHQCHRPLEASCGKRHAS